MKANKQNGGDKEMFVGSFHRVVSKNDIESRIPTSSSPCIVYVEEEKKLYEKNTYGMVTEYLSLGTVDDDRYDFTPEITDLEERVHELEKQVKILGGVVNVY